MVEFDILRISVFQCFQNYMAAILDLEVKIVLNLKNSHFIGFVIQKIVKFCILYIVIPCFQSYRILCFSKWRWAAILDLEVEMFQNLKKNPFHCFFHIK